jgi:putative spermidine/putrescine transport system ATP-binding protein
MSEPPDVILQGIRVVRGGRTVLEIPSLRFRSGRTTAVFGPNGAGKTTLLRTIAGLERPAAGAIHVGHAPPRPGTVAYAFQRAVFLRGTVRENLALGLQVQRVPVPERRRRIAEAARECGIETLLDRPAHQLSAGEAQRASVARALTLEAPLTLLDEPLTGIDRVTRAQLLDDLPALLRRFAATTILVTHDRDEAVRLADDIVVLAAGRVLAAGSKRALHAAPPNPETATLLGYTVLEVDGQRLAVPPGGLVIGAAPAWGRPRIALTVLEISDTGRDQRLLGLAGGKRVEVTLPADMAPPAAGSVIEADIVESVPIIFAAPDPILEQR